MRESSDVEGSCLNSLVSKVNLTSIRIKLQTWLCEKIGTCEIVWEKGGVKRGPAGQPWSRVSSTTNQGKELACAGARLPPEMCLHGYEIEDTWKEKERSSVCAFQRSSGIVGAP